MTVTIGDGAGGFFESTGQGKVTHYRAAPPDGQEPLVDLTAGIIWNSPVTSMIQFGESTTPGLVVGLGDGAVQQWIPGDPTDPSQSAGSWKELKDQGWQSAVNVLLPYKGRPDVCEGGCNGFLVGLNNGSVHQYNEARNGAGQPRWYELQGSGWGSAVRGMVLSQTDSSGLPTFAVGLGNGAVQQWNNVRPTGGRKFRSRARTAGTAH